MRTTFRVIAAAFALLFATPALGASEFDIANAEHDANTGASNGAKRVTPVDASGASLVSGGLKSNIVDTSGDSAVDATANAVKTVDVDNAGTALAGGRGSRVELLYSGTYSTVTGGVGVWTPIRSAFTPPAWCHTVVFTGRIDAITIGPGASLSFAAVHYDVDGEFFTTSAGAERGLESAAVVTPTINNGIIMTIGPETTSVNTPLAGTSYYSYPTAALPQIGFAYNWATAPTSWTLKWTVHCLS